MCGVVGCPGFARNFKGERRIRHGCHVSAVCKLTRGRGSVEVSKGFVTARDTRSPCGDLGKRRDHIQHYGGLRCQQCCGCAPARVSSLAWTHAAARDRHAFWSLALLRVQFSQTGPAYLLMPVVRCGELPEVFFAVKELSTQLEQLGHLRSIHDSASGGLSHAELLVCRPVFYLCPKTPYLFPLKLRWCSIVDLCIGLRS